MPPEQISDLSAAGLLFTLCMGILLMALPRKRALLPIVLTTCYMTVGQQIVVGSLHFTVLRILIVLAYVRVFSRGETRGVRWLRLDKMVLACTVSGVVIYSLLFLTSEALINRLGVAWDTVGIYFVLRCLVRDVSDIKQVTAYYAVALAGLTMFIGVEKLTGRNPFSALGGVPEITMVRLGTLRCQGPFRHPILAGTFGAVWLPLFVGLWWSDQKYRLPALLGIAASVTIPILSGSSGPLVTLLSGCVGLGLRFAQRQMRTVRWAIVFALLALHVAMKEPIWFIFARVNILSGSTGWHRSHLIDQTIKHFSEWCVLGINVDEVGRWGVWGSDITCQYLLAGIQGGFLTMVLFIGVIVSAYSGIGRVLRTTRPDMPQLNRLAWALGSAVLAHVMTYLSVSYFDQNIVNWYLLLAMIAAMITLYAQRPAVAPATATAPMTAEEPTSVLQ